MPRSTGRQRTVQEATAEAARLLATKPCPVVAGLGTDVAGAPAAGVALAQRVVGRNRPHEPDALLKQLDVMQRHGNDARTTPNEARCGPTRCCS